MPEDVSCIDAEEEYGEVYAGGVQKRLEQEISS
jgi:hypothetical protein